MMLEKSRSRLVRSFELKKPKIFLIFSRLGLLTGMYCTHTDKIRVA